MGRQAVSCTILLWIYYSARIVLFGAEFTHVYAPLSGFSAPETSKLTT
ncbi:MAG: hypothetical protein IPK19_07615 [Chloroflexi bacterium]|nr:hypothetical protein [Chloroflexota bacterium]